MTFHAVRGERRYDSRGEADGRTRRFAGRFFAGSWPRPAAMSTTFLLVWLGANSTTAGMVFLVLVVWSASQAGIALSLYIAVLCALSFDYFFLPPVRTLWLEGAQAWVAMVSFALSCVVVGRLAERARHQTLQAEQRQEDVERLYALSQEMMLFEDADAAHPRSARADRPHLRSRGSGSLRPRPGPVLLLDRRSAGQRTGTHAGHDPGPEPHPGAVRRLPHDCADAGAAAGGSTGVAARYAFARGRHGGQRPGIDCRGALHCH